MPTEKMIHALQALAASVTGVTPIGACIIGFLIFIVAICRLAG